MKLLAVGTIAFDAIETPFGKTDKTLGGAATYIGLAASTLHTEVGLVSVVGGDFPKDCLDMMIQKNINIEGVEIIPNGKTFFWAGKYHNDLNARDTITTELNVLESFDPKIPKTAENIEVLLLGNLHPSVQMSVLEKLKQRPKIVILDTMNFWMKHTWELLLEMIAQTDVICINDEEARQLSGEYSLVKAAQKIQTMGPKFVIIKKGEHGALLFNEHQIFAIPALPLEEVFDPTGAGDSFAGGFAAHLAKTQDYSFDNMKTALIVGSAIASYTVEKFGTERLSEINKKMLKERIEEFKKLTAFEIQL